MEGDVLDELTEVIVAGDEIGFAIHLDQDADLPTHVDVGSDDAFFGFASSFLGGGKVEFFAEDFFAFFEVAFGFFEGAFAVHHARIGFFAEQFDVLGVYAESFCHKGIG